MVETNVKYKKKKKKRGKNIYLYCIHIWKRNYGLVIWYGVVRTGLGRLFWVTFFLLFCLYLSSFGAPGGSNLGVVLALLGLGSCDDQ